MAEEEFDRVFRDKGLPDEIPEKRFSKNALPILVPRLIAGEGLVTSNSEARRLIDQGGVKINGNPLTDRNYQIAEPGEYLLKVGSRRFLRVIVE